MEHTTRTKQTTTEYTRQQYLDLAHRFAHGDINSTIFLHTLMNRWAVDREIAWRAAQDECAYRTMYGSGSGGGWDRPLLRLLDRLIASPPRKRREEERDYEGRCRQSAQEMLDAYARLRRGGDAGDGGDALLMPARINVFERPCPPHRAYPCTAEDIRHRLTGIPEQDLVRLWAVGLMPADHETRDAHGIYYRHFWRAHGPVIHLLSHPMPLRVKLGWRYTAQEVERRFWVELSFGVRVVGHSSPTVLKWDATCLRHYILDHVLPHEVGHHVQYQRRWLAGHRRDLPSSQKEQFAEDYALRGGLGRRE